MSDTFDEFTDKAKRAAAESAEELKAKLASLKEVNLDELNEAVNEMAGDAAAFVRKYPIASVVGALTAGVVLGAIMSRRR